MTYTFELQIAGFNVQVLDDSNAPCEWFLKRCNGFLAADSLSTLPIKIQIKRNPDFSRNGEDFVYEPLAGKGSSRLIGFDFIAQRKRGESSIYVEAHPEFGMAGLLRALLSIFLLENGGVLLHAASFGLGDKAIIFAGESGSGKTTLSRLAQGHFSVFTDETTAIRFEDGKAVAYSTPFCGELGIVAPNISAPIENLFFLKHAARNFIKPLSLIDASSRLIGCTFLPIRTEPWLSCALRFSEKICRSISCHEFGFCPEKKAVEVIDGFIREPSTAP
jgi:hypothetical protein